MITRIDHMHVMTTDMDRRIAFYTEGLPVPES
jgi:catechol 2,3-dioxygenase-like lactoylglutathione lyase family enzyme